jgi:hypothetical protein
LKVRRSRNGNITEESFMPDDPTRQNITDVEPLKDIIGEPEPAIANQEAQALDKHFGNFVCLSTPDAGQKP